MGSGADASNGAPKFRYAKVDARVLDLHGAAIGPKGLAVYLCLAMHDYGSRTPFPSHNTIASKTGMSVRSVQSAIKLLRDRGLIEVRRRKGRGNIYTLNHLDQPDPLQPRQVLPVLGGEPRHGLPVTPARFAGDPGTVCRRRSGIEDQELKISSSTPPLRKATDAPDGLEPERSAADAAELSPPTEKPGLPAAASGCPRAADPAPSGEVLEALVERGLTRPLAARYAASADPALIREILVYHQANGGVLDNPVGALRSMLDRPEEWGFVCEGGTWKPPPPPRRRGKSNGQAAKGGQCGSRTTSKRFNPAAHQVD
jgi:hypothetical protein